MMYHTVVAYDFPCFEAVKSSGMGGCRVGASPESECIDRACDKFSSSALAKIVFCSDGCVSSIFETIRVLISEILRL